MSRAKKLRTANRKRRSKILKGIAFIFILLTFASFTAIASMFASAAKELPNLEKQGLGKNAETTIVYASDGTTLATLFVEQNRVVVPLSDIPKELQQSVIAIEDERFYKHHGVDLEAIGRALIVDIQEGRIVEGASTITQQYVKNTFITPEKTLKRKIKEAILAYQIEKKYNKKKILEKYLNTIYFGQSTYGVEVAAQTFFGKKAKDLTLAESALLAGLIKSPNSYSPYTNPEGARKRREKVLQKMVEVRFITQKQADETNASPIVVKEIEAKTTRAPYFVEYVKQQILENKKYGSTPSERANVLFKGGLRIYTTLNLKMQQDAEEAVKLLGRADDPSAALVAIDPKTGQIKALVGGKDFKTSKFNLATQGKRQSGSAFKVFVLTSAIENGFSPNDTYESSPTTIRFDSQSWHVTNATEGSGGGRITIREGTVRSVNCVYARLIMDVKPENVAEMAHRMGIKSPVPAYPSIALGTAEVTPLEMASAFSTLANDGMHEEPTAIAKITDTKGKIIEESKPKATRVVDGGTAYTVTDILQGVIQGGTGRAANIGRPAAGKTGTTNSYADAWFVGFTPNLSCAVWVGYPQKKIPMVDVHGIRVMGGTFPAQIWARFMLRALEDTPESKFAIPEDTGTQRVKICKDSGLLATSFCPNTIFKTFVSGDAPTRYCNIHRGKTVPSVVGMSKNQAVSSLSQVGFNVSVAYKQSSEPQDEVIDQSPRGGAQAEEGGVVTIVVSSGPPEEPPPPPTPPGGGGGH